MPTISESRTERDAWTYNRCRTAFIAGVIGEVTFLATLQILGLPSHDAKTEVNLAKMEMRR